MDRVGQLEASRRGRRRVSMGAAVPVTIALSLLFPAAKVFSATPVEECVVSVDAGDTLYGIGRQTGHSAAELAQVNGIANPGLIGVGQRIRYCAGPAPEAATSAPQISAAQALLASAERQQCPQQLTGMPSEACYSFLAKVMRAGGYGDVTEVAAVRAFQKRAGDLTVDGIIGPNTGNAELSGRGLAQPQAPADLSDGLVVSKSQQLVYEVGGGAVRRILDARTGDDRAYADLGTDGIVHQGIATTPLGDAEVVSVEGPEFASPLGAMPSARFLWSVTGDGRFSGIAVHGGNTTTAEGSHGCVRVDRGTASGLALGLGGLVRVQDAGL